MRQQYLGQIPSMGSFLLASCVVLSISICVTNAGGSSGFKVSKDQRKHYSRDATTSKINLSGRRTTSTACDFKCTTDKLTRRLAHSNINLHHPFSKNKTTKRTLNASLSAPQSVLAPSSSRVKTLSSGMRKVPNLEQLNRKVSESRKECKLKHSKSFYCQRVRWSWWFIKQLDKNTTVLNDFMELVHRTESDVFLQDETQLLPENWLENVVYKFITDWGSPADKLVFLKLKKYSKSRELKVKFPRLDSSIQIGPSTHSAGETGRIFFDPGFNLKMKLPFFRDEMKFAVSTGPSFLAGLGVGIVVLGIKSIFAPVMLAMKAMMLSYFMRDMSPFDFFRVFGFGTASPDETADEVHNIEVYDPPLVNNPYDNVLDKHSPTGGSNALTANGDPNLGVGGYGSGQHSNPMNYYQKQQQQQQHHPQSQYGIPVRLSSLLPYAVPTVLTAPSSQQSQSRPQPSPWALLNGADGNGRGRPISSPSEIFANKINGNGKLGGQKKPESGYQYVPSAALQLEVEDFDPFYSPLLSRIDSIFMHLGFGDEGCKERAVCSIYKSPVKYAPYSNLLSAQLSKHQSELKRPVSTSPKILRYFKYMKAAKDGQGSMNCIELYPSCTNDTEKLTNLPMVKTFQQLTELMGSETG